MTASLLVIVCVSLLVLVAGFGFVGCLLDTHGTGGDPGPKPFTQYSEVDVLGNANCVAYWPLDDAAPKDDTGKIVARDAKGANDGEYKHKNNAAPLVPIPAFDAGGTNSAAAPGFLSLGVEQLLPGDAKQPANDATILTTGAQVDGAFVTVPLSATINPAGPFSVEIWARPEWPADNVPTLHVLLDARGNAGGAHGGYAIWVNTDGNWQAVVLSSGLTNAIVTGGMATPNERNHVVLVLDGAKVTLFVNGAEAGSNTVPMGQSFTPNTTVPLVMGVGNVSSPDRPALNAAGNFFPNFPFKGTMQCVAIYNAALSAEVIDKHFRDGSGLNVVTPG